jgi:type I restriction enzyme M protein
MARLLEPQEGETIYDPACGSGGLVIKAHLRLRERVAKKRRVDPRRTPFPHPEESGLIYYLFCDKIENK